MIPSNNALFHYFSFIKIDVLGGESENNKKIQKLESRIHNLESENHELKKKALFFDELVRYPGFFITRFDLLEPDYCFTNNPTHEKIHKNNPHDFLGGFNQIIEDIHPDDQETVVKNVYTLLNTEKGQASIQHEYRKKSTNDHEYNWMREDISLINDANGSPRAVLVIGYNITDKRLIESAYHHEKNLNQRILESSPNIIYLKNEDGRFVIINESLAKLFEMERATLLRSLNSDAEYHSNAFFDRHDQEVLATNQSLTYHEKFISPSNKTYWLHTTKTVLTLADGQRYILANSTDVTQTKLAQNQLRNSESRYRHLIDSLNSPFITLDAQFNAVIINKTALEYFQCSESNCIGKKYTSFIDGSFGITDEMLHKVNHSKESVKHECRIDHSVLGKRWIWYTIEPIINRKDDETVLQILMFDITTLKENEEKLRRSEMISRGIINAANDHIYLLNDNLCVVTANEAALNHLGLSHEEIYGLTAWELFNPDEGLKKQQMARRVLKTGEMQRTEEKIGDIYVELTMYPIVSEKNMVNSIVVMNRNITMLKNAEIETRKALEKEQMLNKLKSSVISTVSHEFRTPVAIISSNTQILEKYRQKLTSNDFAKKIKLISNSLQHLDQMMNAITMLDKSNKDPLSFSPSIIDFEKLCYEIADEHESIDTERERIRLNISSTLGKVQMDDTLLRYIISNLLTNALKYSNIDSMVTFSTKNGNNFTVIITVIDEGIGIKSDEIRNVAEPFFRGSNVRNIKGTGVGFSILKRCVQLHHGKVRIESKINKGTKVIVTLPYKNI